MVYRDYLQWPSLTQHARILIIVSFHRVIDRCTQVRTNNIANSKPVVVMAATAGSALTGIVLLYVADVADYIIDRNAWQRFFLSRKLIRFPLE